MMFEIDYRLEARVAMELATLAKSDADRVKWVPIAVAWQDLARNREEIGATYQGHVSGT